MSFLASEAAFDGFRLTRHHPKAVLAWAGIMLAANLVSAFVISVLAGPKWAAFEAAAADGQADMQALGALLPQVGPAALISLLLQLAATGIVHASVMRGLLEPSRPPPLRVGIDAFRVVGLILSFIGVSFAATLALGLVFGLVGALGAPGAGLTSLAGLVVSVLLGIRLSLVGPITIAEKKFQFWASWRATKGYGFKLLGAELLAAALAVAVVLLAHMVFVALFGVIVVMRGGQIADVATMFSADMSSPASMLQAAPLIYMAFASILYGMVLAILLAPPIALYKVLRRNGAWEDGAGI